MSYCAKLTGEDLSSNLNKIESVGLRYKNAKKTFVGGGIAQTGKITVFHGPLAGGNKTSLRIPF